VGSASSWNLTIALSAQASSIVASVQLSGSNVIEDVGSPAELIAQAATLAGLGKPGKTGLGNCLAQAASTAGLGQIARVASLVELTAQAAQAYGTSERLVVAQSAALAAGTAAIAGTTTKAAVGSGALVTQPAEFAASIGSERTGTGDLVSATASTLGSWGSHSTAFGQVGSGDLVAQPGELASQQTLDRVGTGALVADDASIETTAYREFNLTVALVSQEAVLVGQADFGDQTSWESDDATWGQPSLIHAREWPVFTKELQFFQADIGSKFYNEAVHAVLERTGLSVLGRDRFGNWKVNPGVIKFVSGLWPLFRGTPGDKIRIYVGSQMQTEEPITWEGPYEATIGETEFLDYTVSGRYIAVRFESIGQNPWELVSYDLDITTVGGR